MGLDYALVLLRLAVGLAVAAHGAQKLFGWFGGYGIAGTGGFLESIGFRPGKVFATAAGTSEFAGGLLIALGLFGAVGPMLVLSTMLVAILTMHIKHGFFAQDNGIELPFTYAIVAIALALAGYGSYALDAMLGITVTSQPAVTGILLALGVLGALGNLLVRRAPAAQQAPNH